MKNEIVLDYEDLEEAVTDYLWKTGCLPLFDFELGGLDMYQAISDDHGLFKVTILSKEDVVEEEDREGLNIYLNNVVPLK